jgi:hypothetical protein
VIGAASETLIAPIDRLEQWANTRAIPWPDDSLSERAVAEITAELTGGGQLEQDRPSGAGLGFQLGYKTGLPRCSP